MRKLVLTICNFISAMNNSCGNTHSGLRQTANIQDPFKEGLAGYAVNVNIIEQSVAFRGSIVLVYSRRCPLVSYISVVLVPLSPG